LEVITTTVFEIHGLAGVSEPPSSEFDRTLKTSGWAFQFRQKNEAVWTAAHFSVSCPLPHQ
jgi:hypothetical protein